MSGIIYLQAGEEIQQNFILCSTFTLNPAGSNIKRSQTSFYSQFGTIFPFKLLVLQKKKYCVALKFPYFKVMKFYYHVIKRPVVLIIWLTFWTCWGLRVWCFCRNTTKSSNVFFVRHREKKQKIHDIKNNIKEAIEVRNDSFSVWDSHGSYVMCVLYHSVKQLWFTVFLLLSPSRPLWLPWTHSRLHAS